MGSRWRSFFREPDHSSTTSIGTTNNYGSSLEIQASFSSAGKSQCSDVVSEVVEEENPMAQLWRTPSLKEFSFKDLKIATNNFSPDRLLGQGGFGLVYKGWVDEETLAPSKRGIGTAVAIKILKPESFQGFEEWQTEVNFLGRHYHPNIIILLAYHWENEKLALVYELVEKGSLADHLFKGSAVPLSWDMRFKIVIGTARGLTFLHTLEKKIIYRNLKTSNILLDKNYNAKLSGFNLALLGPSSEESPISTKVMGTSGYGDPAYIATGNIYLKSDVYNYGIILLELLTGLRALDGNRPPGQHCLVDWLKPKLSQREKLKPMMDVRMEGQYSFEEAVQVAQLSLKCLESDPQSRPSMKEVVELLKEIEAMKDTNT